MRRLFAQDRLLRAPATLLLLGVFLPGILLLLHRFAFAQAPVPATAAEQMTSDEHLARPGWWPRKGDAPRSDYLGAKVCAECHSEYFQDQQKHAMAHTSMPVSESEHLTPPGTFNLGPYHFSVGFDKNGADKTGATYTVTNGKESFSAPIIWAVGSGSRGQSYLFETGGALYEARISFYRSVGFDITPDHPTGVPDSMEHALGRKIGTDEAPNCLGCHATAAVTSGKVDTKDLIPGISCEGCHGPGAAHVALARSGVTSPGLIANPVHLDPVMSVDFCGSCHRTWWDITQLGYHGHRNVRFPAYRLVTSRCWGKGDARITCVACHDPHKPLVNQLSAYDEKCLACHAKSNTVVAADHPGRACPVSADNCVSCHMPKYQLDQMRSPFTDHRIRIVRDTDPKNFPDE